MLDELRVTGIQGHLNENLSDRFLQIYKRDEEELRRYWLEQLKVVKVMGRAYLESFEAWSGEEGREVNIAFGANQLALFLLQAALLAEAEPLMCRVVEILLNFTRATGHQHPYLQTTLNNYITLLQTLGQSREQIAETIEALGLQYVVNLGLGDKQAAAETSSRLRKVIKELKQDPSKIKEVAEKLQRENPAPFAELIKLLKNRQNY